MTTKVWPLVSNTIAFGGTSQVAAYGPILGGYIVNPLTAAEQRIGVAEPLYIDIVGPAAQQATATTSQLLPGGVFNLPNITGPFQVSVSAATPGHLFGGVVYQPYSFVPSKALFPPVTYTTETKIIPSYLYEQYNDDENLQAFVNAYNQMAQNIFDWFVTVGLPIYPNLSGTLLDWVAGGVYGFVRPVLPSGLSQTIGALNTWALNTIELNAEDIRGPDNYFLTSDDVFKRIITWHFYKGDGKYMNVRRLKRMVTRFLNIADGWGDPVDTTYQVSVTFGVDGEVNINLQGIRRIVTGGAIFNFSALNEFALDELDTVPIALPVSPLTPIFKAAMESGVLEFPFQFTPIVNI